MSRLRHHYETALTTSSSLHQQEVAEMKQELASVREHTQQQVRILLCTFGNFSIITCTGDSYLSTT